MPNLKQLHVSIRLCTAVVSYLFLAGSLGVLYSFQKNCSESLPVKWHLSGKRTLNLYLEH